MRDLLLTPLPSTWHTIWFLYEHRSGNASTHPSIRISYEQIAFWTHVASLSVRKAPRNVYVTVRQFTFIKTAEVMSMLCGMQGCLPWRPWRLCSPVGAWLRSVPQGACALQTLASEVGSPGRLI